MNESLVRDDLAKLGAHGDSLYGLVFDRWLAADESARLCFERNGMSSRREMLETTFVAVYDLLERASWLKWNLTAYGARHEGVYFVEDSMYASYVDAIVEALGAALGPSFDDAHAEAWRAVLGRVCEGMRRWTSVDAVAAAVEKR